MIRLILLVFALTVGLGNAAPWDVPFIQFNGSNAPKSLTISGSANVGKALLFQSPGTLTAADVLTQSEWTTERATLDTQLAGKAATSHTHTASQISDSTATGRSVLTAATAAAARSALGLGNLATANTLVIGDTIGLQAALDAKAATVHDHSGQDLNPGNVEASGQLAGHGLLVRQIGGAASSAYFNPASLTDERNYDLPDASGTLALTSYVDAAIAGVSGALPDPTGQDGKLLGVSGGAPTWVDNVVGGFSFGYLHAMGTGEDPGFLKLFTQGDSWWTRLEAPYANTNRTLALPNEDGTLATQSYAASATDLADFQDTQLGINSGFASDIATLNSSKAPKGAIGSSGMTQAPSKVLGRTSAGTGAIEELGISAVLDLVGGLGQGSVLYRGATQWAATGTGAAGEVLTSGGAGNDPTWAAGGGLPTQTGNSGKLLTTNGTAASWTTTTAQLDGIGSTRGQVLYRGSSAWAALAAGTSGYYLRANGAGADPTWAVLPLYAGTGAGSGAGGSVSTAAGNYALAFGFQCDAGNDMAQAFGTYAKSEVYSSIHQSGGRFAVSGDSLSILSTFRAAATSATPVELFANGSSERFTVKANTVANCDIRVVAKQQSSTNCASFWRRATICRDGSNNTSLVGSVETIGTDQNSPGWSIAVTADDTNESLKVTFTGAAATNVRATMTLFITETSY